MNSRRIAIFGKWTFVKRNGAVLFIPTNAIIVSFLGLREFAHIELTAVFCRLLSSYHLSPVGEGVPSLEIVRYRGDAGRADQQADLWHLPPGKIRLISCGPMAHVSDIKLIRTDTTLDLSQKAEKGILRQWE